MVGAGFEPAKLSRQIYSLIPLAAREPHQMPLILIRSLSMSSPCCLSCFLKNQCANHLFNSSYQMVTDLLNQPDHSIIRLALRYSLSARRILEKLSPGYNPFTLLFCFFYSRHMTDKLTSEIVIKFFIIRRIQFEPPLLRHTG